MLAQFCLFLWYCHCSCVIFSKLFFLLPLLMLLLHMPTQLCCPFWYPFRWGNFWYLFTPVASTPDATLSLVAPTPDATLFLLPLRLKPLYSCCPYSWSHFTLVAPTPDSWSHFTLVAPTPDAALFLLTLLQTQLYFCCHYRTPPDDPLLLLPLLHTVASFPWSL